MKPNYRAKVLNTKQNRNHKVNKQQFWMKQIFFTLLFAMFIISFASVGLLYGQELLIPQILSDHDLNRLSPNSFNRYYKNVYSQCGEDGILDEIFKRLNIEKGFCIEFGAADGIWFSNTRYLWEKGWLGVMIEADCEKFAKLAACYANDPNMICLSEFVTWHENDPSGKTIDQIADIYFPGREIDFLSIDIDGADYLILETLKMQPKVICVESGLHWHPLFIQRIPDEVALQNLEQPLAVMIQIARSKGYEPLCLTGNLILIRSDLFYLFPDTPSDELTIWCDGWRSTFCREWLVNYRENHPFIKQFEGINLQLACPITVDF